MTLKSAVLRMMSFGIAVALHMGIASAQESQPDATKVQEPTAAVKSQPEAAAPSKLDAEVHPPAGKEGPTAEAAPDSKQPGDPVIQSRKDKLSYAFGVDLARDIERQKNSLNVDLLLRALTDRLTGKKLVMTDEEVSTTVKAFDAEQKEDLQHARMMISERNKKEGEAFFAENAKKEGVVTLPSGLQYKILKKGEGKIPTLDDIVLCNYTGKLLDGTEIDSSYKRKEPTAVPVKGVIPGWAQALQMMPVGTKWEMYIPPQLAYTDRAAAALPPNVTLVFEVELLSIQEKPKAVGALTDTPAATTAKREPVK